MNDNHDKQALLIVESKKVIQIDKDVVTRLRAILDDAEKGNVSDFAMVFLKPDGPCFSHSYRLDKRIQMIGCLEVLKSDLVSRIDTEGET